MFIEQKTLREIQPIKSLSFDCPCMPSCMLLLCCLSNPISNSPIIQINYMLCFTVCTLSCYALCMPSGGPLNSKLALGPSKAMKSLKHLLHPAHFLYVQNFPTSTEFYWKINAFQCFQGEWTFEGCKTITTFGDEFFIGSDGVGGQGERKKSVGNAVWYRRHPTLWGELSETVCPTSETPCAQHLNCRRLDARVTIYWLVLQFQQTFRSNFISCSSSQRFDIALLFVSSCVSSGGLLQQETVTRVYVNGVALMSPDWLFNPWFTTNRGRSLH